MNVVECNTFIHVCTQLNAIKERWQSVHIHFDVNPGERLKSTPALTPGWAAVTWISWKNIYISKRTDIFLWLYINYENVCSKPLRNTLSVYTHTQQQMNVITCVQYQMTDEERKTSPCVCFWAGRIWNTETKHLIHIKCKKSNSFIKMTQDDLKIYDDINISGYDNTSV